MRRAAKVDANQNAIVAELRGPLPFAQWKCRNCGIEKTGTVHQMRHTYCSKSCMAAAYKVRQLGARNPNYRGAMNSRLCLKCGNPTGSYNTAQKYCSLACYWATPDAAAHAKANSLLAKGAPRAKKVKPPAGQRQCPFCLKVPLLPHRRSCGSAECKAASYAKSWGKHPKRVYENNASCVQCRSGFFKLASSNRRYCSYKCHLDSGGAFRAGLAAAEARQVYGPKKDANHNDVVAAMREVNDSVRDTSSLGRGMPDGLIWINGGWQLFDIKNPKTGYGRRGLNKTQKKWIGQRKGGPVYLIYNEEEGRRFAAGDLTGLKMVQSAGEPQ